MLYKSEEIFSGICLIMSKTSLAVTLDRNLKFSIFLPGLDLTADYNFQIASFLFQQKT